MTETLVLLAVRLKDMEKVPALLHWDNWCHHLAPNDAASVHTLGRLQLRDLVRLEGYFLSNSSLVLISLSIFLWDRLPPNSSYSFVAFIKSINSLLPAWVPQMEIYLSSSANHQDSARVHTMTEVSEPE